MMKNCQIIEHTLNRRNIPWCYCINDFADFPDTMKLLRDKGFIGSENYLGNDFTAIDQVSKEDPHPGPKSHKLFAAQLFDWIQEKYSGRLRAIANGEGTQDHST